MAGDHVLFSLVVPALVALFGVFLVRADWRDGITAVLVVSYVLMLLTAVGLSAFGVVSIDEGIRGFLLRDFTSLMLIVVLSYFGSEAVSDVAKRYAEARVAGSSANAANRPAGDQSADAQADSR